jgi:hypothetical protein
LFLLIAGSRRSCRYGQDCTRFCILKCFYVPLIMVCFVFLRHDNDHREDFAHPGDSDYHVAGSASTGQPKCRYASECYRYVIFSETIVFICTKNNSLNSSIVVNMQSGFLSLELAHILFSFLKDRR